MEQLSAVGREIKVEALGLKIVTGTLVALRPQEIFHDPGTCGQLRNGQRYIALATMRSQIHDHQIKLWRLLLPLHDD